MSSMREAFLFLIKFVFEIYFLVVLIRFIFDFLKVKTTNFLPIIPFIYTITDVLIKPLQKFLPLYKGINLATLTLLFLIKALELIFIVLLTKGAFPGILALLIWPIGEILSQTLNFFFFTVIIATLFSWFVPAGTSSITPLLFQLTDRILQPARKIVPLVANFDISPLVVLIVLKFVDILVALPLIRMGINLA